MAARWYIIHVYSGFEKKVMHSIREQAIQQGLADLFEEILCRWKRWSRSSGARRSAPSASSSRLRAGQDGADRRDLASRAQHRQGDRVPQLAAGRCRSPRPRPSASCGRCRKASSIRACWSRSCRAIRCAWSTARSARSTAWSRKSTKAGPPLNLGLDLRPGDGRARVFPGREAVGSRGSGRLGRAPRWHRTSRGAIHGQEDRRVHQAAGAGRQANPSPPIGPALGQRGLNIMEFCKQFNAATQNLEPGMPIPVVITAFADRTFTFATKTPPASYFSSGQGQGLEKWGRRRAATPSARSPSRRCA